MNYYTDLMDGKDIVMKIYDIETLTNRYIDVLKELKATWRKINRKENEAWGTNNVVDYKKFNDMKKAIPTFTFEELAEKYLEVLQELNHAEADWCAWNNVPFGGKLYRIGTPEERVEDYFRDNEGKKTFILSIAIDCGLEDEQVSDIVKSMVKDGKLQVKKSHDGEFWAWGVA